MSPVTTVDVVVPCADGERYLAEALRSVMSQQPRPVSVVVVDDASTDGSVVVARDLGVATVELSERAGPNAARMAGLVRGEAELVAFCDADDRWTPGRLGRMVEVLDAHPEAAGVIGRVEVFATPDRDVRRFEVPVGPQPGVVIGAVLIRRRDIEAAGGLRVDLLGGELLVLERALDELGRPLVRMDDVVLERRIHGDNLTIRRADDVRRAYLRLAVERVRGSA